MLKVLKKEAKVGGRRMHEEEGSGSIGGESSIDRCCESQGRVVESDGPEWQDPFTLSSWSIWCQIRAGNGVRIQENAGNRRRICLSCEPLFHRTLSIVH